MKRYAAFTARFALVPMISGPFWPGLEWAHIITGFATVYLVIGLLLMSMKHRQIRLQGIVTPALALLEAIPGTPQLHAAVSPVLFASLAWAVIALHSERPPGPARSRWIFVLPAL